MQITNTPKDIECEWTERLLVKEDEWNILLSETAEISLVEVSTDEDLAPQP